MHFYVPFSIKGLLSSKINCTDVIITVIPILWSVMGVMFCKSMRVLHSCQNLNITAVLQPCTHSRLV
jgi:hypothetical protein